MFIGAALLILACSEEMVDPPPPPPPPPPDESPWTKHENNPVLSPSANRWDDLRVNYPDIIFDGTTYKMWYAGETLTTDGFPWYRLGLATSSNGVNWSKHNANPVINEGTNGGFVGTPVVIHDGTLYHMWYSARRFEAGTGFGFEIEYATSPDGITWTKFAGNPVIIASPRSWEEISVFPCEVIYDGTTYQMWYAGGDLLNTRPERQQLGYATSSDGFTWVKSGSNPVFKPATSVSWDNLSVFPATIVFDGTTYHMWYTGSKERPFNTLSTEPRIGYASSTDGINWMKDPDNPIMGVGESGMWDDFWVGHPRVIFDGTTYHMWYSGYDGQEVRIGYASSTQPF